MIDRALFTQYFEQMGFPVDGTDFLLFDRYAELLVDWNKRVNLTAITDPQGILVKHFVDSLLPICKVDLPPKARVVDVGAGAGFPSVPIKLMRGDLQLTLLDSLEKRLTFLRALCQELGREADTLHLRAEDAGRKPQYREQFDVAVSRAVAPMAELAEYCLPLVEVGGLVLALKGSVGREEAIASQRAVQLCGGIVEDIIDYSLPNGDPRVLVVLRKHMPTPDKYPRHSAQISKKPL